MTYNPAYILFLFFLFAAYLLPAQEVLISQEVNLRNTKKYVILGKKENNIQLFRDRESAQEVDVFDENLSYKYSRDVKLEGDNNKIFAVIGHGKNESSVIYGSYLKDSVRLRQYVINGDGEMKDTSTLITVEKKQLRSNLKYAYSENEQRLLLFNNVKDDKLNLFMINLPKRTLSWEATVVIKNKSEGYRFLDMVVSNEEDVFILYEKANNRYMVDDHAFMLYHLGEDAQYFVELTMPDYLSKDSHLTYDELNNNILLIGLYTQANRSSALGYFTFSSSRNGIGSSDEILFSPFDASFIEEVNGKRKGVNNTLDYYFIKDVIFQKDGSFVWIGEMYKQYVRRAPSPYNRGGGNGLQGYIDHYTEDIVVFSVDKDGSESWRNVIFKKQFSQDDDATYSSFFLMKSPSRLRLFFNDEIKRSNTVSAYHLDPLGNMKRETVMNTEYENLKLRFQDGIQIANESLLLASEGSGMLNLVKISL